MVSHQVSGVGLRGIASAVPQTIQTAESLADIFGEEATKKLIKRVGVRERRVAGVLCSSDLCEVAAERLLQELAWDKASIDALLFVTQTPDYVLPATACSLHERLSLSSHCIALDINLGCSGYIYGLWMASQFLMGGAVKRLLLLVGDTPSRFVSPEDRSTAPLFGDAGTATALEFVPEALSLSFSLGTDGTGGEHLMIPAGSFRQPHTESTEVRKEQSDGSIRSDEDLSMNGAEVFAFALREIPDLVKTTLALAEWDIEHVDAFVPHQANAFLLRHLAKRMKLPLEKMHLNLEQFGNTSCASIPLAITTELAGSLSRSSMNLLLVGFGVGWSWGAVALTAAPMVLPALIEVESSHFSLKGVR